MGNSRLIIGVSACVFAPDPQRTVFRGKRLLYAEESMLQWLSGSKALPFLIPTESPSLRARDYVKAIDGLVLQGGSDISPQSYGETPLDPRWEGDYFRDQYESALVLECLKADKPILGICRGLQLLNVALGGSMLQDIQTQIPNSLVHRNPEIYVRNSKIKVS